MHRAEENEKKCIMIFCGSSFQERGLITAPVQEIRFVMMSSGVTSRTWEDISNTLVFWSFYPFKEFLYLASSLNHLYLRDPC